MAFEILGLEKADIDKAHKWSLEMMRMNQLQESDFTDRYSEKEISRDIELADRKEREFDSKNTPEQKENKKIADILEGIILYHAEQNMWLGDVVTKKTSRYDDYINGIDILVEFLDEEMPTSHLGLAVDVTFTSDTTEKFDKTLDRIERGVLGQLKYSDPEVKQDRLPEVIIGISRKLVMELAEMQLVKDMGFFKEHPVQIMMLTQIKEQLEVYALYAHSLGRTDLESAYASLLPTIDQLLYEKMNIAEKSRFEINDDPVHQEIMTYLSNKRRQLNREK